MVETAKKTDADVSIQVQLKSRKDSVMHPISTMLLVDAGLAKANGELKKAIDFYKAAIRVDSTNDAAHYELAKLYKQSEEADIEKALQEIKASIQIDSTNQWYQIFYGRLLVDIGQTNEGISVFQKLKKKYPKNIEYDYELAFAYEQAKQYKKALQVYDQIENQYGFDPEINFRRHNIYFAMDDIEKGIAEIEEISIEYPEYVTYSAYLANYYYEEGNLDKALTFVESVFTQDKKDLQANLIAAKIYAAKEDKAGVKKHLTTFVTNNSLSIDNMVTSLLPFIELMQTFPSVANEILDAVQLLPTLHPEDAKAFALLGDFYSLNDQKEKAISAYEQSLKFDQSVYLVWKQLIGLYSSLDKHTKVKEYSTQMQALYPKDFFANYMTGYSNYRLGNAEQSAQELEKAIALTENEEYQLEIFSLLGDIYHTLKQGEISNQYYEKALALDPHNSYVLNNYSYHLAERKEQLNKAFIMAKKAFELDPENANTIDTLAWVLFQQEKYEEALAMFEKAYQLQDNSAVITEHLGDAHYKNGNKTEAVHFWNKALSLNPGSELLPKKIQEKQFYPKQ